MNTESSGWEVRVNSETLNALVNALERLHVVLGANSSICGLKYRSWTRRQVFGDIQLALDKGPVNDQLRGLVRKARCLPRFDLLAHRLEVALPAVRPNREDVHKAKVLCVLGQHGRERA